MGRHRALLDDPKVRSWWEARSLRSQLSADQYLRQFGFLLEHLKLSPAEVVTLAGKNPDRLRDLLTRDAAKLKREGKLDSYISKFSEGLKSYFRFHHVSFDGFPSLSPIRGASLGNERVPTPEELNRVLERLSLRGRVTALLMAHSGLRPGVLGSYQARAGLTLGDLPDLKLGKEPTFAEVPFVVRVPAALSKTRVAYTTFGTSQLASALLAYLAERRETGEVLSSSSPVVVVLPTRGAASTRRQTDTRFESGFLTTNGLVGEVHRALVSSAPEGVRFRVYVLRSFFSTRLLMAEGAGKITRDLREEMLAHATVASRYNLGKTWGADLLKEARESFRRAEPWLSTTSGKTDNGDEAVARALKILLLARGVPEKTLAGLDLTGKDDEQLKEIVKGLGAAPAPVEKPVSVEEGQRLMAEGWGYVGPFGPSMVLLRAPAAPISTASASGIADAPTA